MQIISISETPNHNTMKITLSESREGMTSDTYTKVDDSQPAFINDILKVKVLNQFSMLWTLFQ